MISDRQIQPHTSRAGFEKLPQAEFPSVGLSKSLSLLKLAFDHRQLTKFLSSYVILNLTSSCLEADGPDSSVRTSPNL